MKRHYRNSSERLLVWVQGKKYKHSVMITPAMGVTYWRSTNTWETITKTAMGGFSRQPMACARYASYVLTKALEADKGE